MLSFSAPSSYIAPIAAGPPPPFPSISSSPGRRRRRSVGMAMMIRERAPEAMAEEEDGFRIAVERGGGGRQRRIEARIAVKAGLEAVWGVITNYEGLPDFIPGLTTSRLLHKAPNFARLYQVGQQDLALGIKFNAKGVIECYEMELMNFPTGGKKREMQFKMVEGDFKAFEGWWSIEEINSQQKDDSSEEKEAETETTLSYTVALEPKLWLPVGLVEGRVCKEVKNNLISVREEAQRIQRFGSINASSSSI